MNDRSKPPGSTLTPVASADGNLATPSSPNPLVTRGLADLASNDKVDVSQPPNSKPSWTGILQKLSALQTLHKATGLRIQAAHLKLRGAAHRKLPCEPPSSELTAEINSEEVTRQVQTRKHTERTSEEPE